MVSGGNWDVRLPLDIPYRLNDRTHGLSRVWLECVWKPRRNTPDLALPAERRAQIRLSDCGRWVVLNLDHANIHDEGLYRIWIENSAGRDYFDVRLHVDDKPHTKLSSPSIHPRAPGQFLLRWNPSSSSEDLLANTAYRIEYCSDKDAQHWELLGSTPIHQTEVLIGDQLETGKRYQFRIRLQNLLGLGPASEPTDFFSPIQDEYSTTHRLTPVGSIRFSERRFSDRYDIVEELARTHHAQIYRLRDRDTGVMRIGKAVELGDISDLPNRHSVSDFRSSVYTPTTVIRHQAEDERRRRAERELRLLSTTEHQNLASLRDVFLDAKRLIWVIDDLVPHTLWDQIQTKIRMTESRASSIMMQLLSLIERLHSQDIAFIGVDPNNIFFTDEKRERIVLGGVSQYHKLTEDRPVRLTFRSAVYMPPEILSSGMHQQMRLQPEASRATDVWSAGALLYQMITGDSQRRPDIDRLKQYNVSPKLLDFFKTILQPDPRKRASVGDSLKHPWLLSDHLKEISTEKKTSSQSVERLSEATSSAYRRLLRKLDWTHYDEAEKDETRLEDFESLRRRKLIEYRRTYRKSLVHADEDDDNEVAVNVLLRARGRAPHIAVPLSNLELYEGSDATLTCCVVPPNAQQNLSDVVVEWSVNGKTLNFDHRPNRLAEKYSPRFDTSTGEASLRVSNLSVYDAGTYSATFRGLFGIVTESANVKINREFLFIFVVCW